VLHEGYAVALREIFKNFLEFGLKPRKPVSGRSFAGRSGFILISDQQSGKHNLKTPVFSSIMCALDNNTVHTESP
jgi:hypothetical protein